METVTHVIPDQDWHPQMLKKSGRYMSTTRIVFWDPSP